MQRITESMDKTMGTAQEITRSQQQAFEALRDNFLSVQGSLLRRNAEVVRGYSEFMRLQETNAKAARDFFASGMRLAELGQRNIRFAQEWMGYGVGFWREAAESGARSAEVVGRSASEQQESLRKLAEQWASMYEGMYEGMFSSWGSYAEEGLKEAQQFAEQTTRQGLRVAEEAVEQTGRTVRQADPNWLPIEGYEELNVSEVSAKLYGLSLAELKKVEAYEKRNKNRETVIEQIERKIKAAS